MGALDSNEDDEIHYSDFLAAMVSTQIALHDGLLYDTFKRFDTDNSGYITVENLKELLGESYDGVNVECLLSEATTIQDRERISYATFASYLKGTQSSSFTEGKGEKFV